jgi:hypothetical protein
MKEFEKNYRAYYQVCRDGQALSEEGKKVLRKLYDSVPPNIDFAKFMVAFLCRPTWNLEESVKWMMEQMKRLSAS